MRARLVRILTALPVLAGATLASAGFTAAPALASEIRPAPYNDGWDGCAGVAGPVDPAVTPPAPATPQPLRAMAFNIAEGGNMPAVAATIRDVNPDIVLLNEVWCDYWAFTDASRQARFLAKEAGLAYYAYEDTARLGDVNPFAKTKGVAILSRFPIVHTRLHMVVWSGEGNKNFGTLQARIVVGGVTHEVYSVRHAPLHTDQERLINEAGHEQDMSRLRAVPLSSAVIYGGDLNAKWAPVCSSTESGDQPCPWSARFRDRSGLFHVLVQKVENSVPPVACHDNAHRIDFIYYRGPYALTDAAEHAGRAGASDHCLVRADFVPKADALVGVIVEGPGEVAPGETYTLTARPVGTTNVTYRWDTGETTASITRTAPWGRGSITRAVTVTARDEVNKFLRGYGTVTWGTTTCWKCGVQ